MLKRIQNIKGIGKRVRDINKALNQEGFYLPWNDSQIELYFRSLKQEMTTVDWNDEEGNKIRLIFTPQIIKEDGYNTTINVIEVEYYTILQIVEQIRKQLHAQKQS
ncbi:hypothetical protein [Acetobacterium wieringae]|uniref:hypothetical protein n=1 Tax=Acetobacterium wieringae TaxID=52694 RepID=UPI00203423D8|nr:hypothetical protein [Acetobacterium wieringae]URN85575.1 hypothetical protein CHL1_001239 [Acetobacterium wieringae]